MYERYSGGSVRHGARAPWLVARLGGAALLAIVSLSCAAHATTEEATAPIRQFYDVLLSNMQNSSTLGPKGRYDRLEPVIQRDFDLTYMTRVAVGPPWLSLSDSERQQVTTAFGRYIAATYASRFDGYSGERLEVIGEQKIKRGTMVQSRIVKSDGEPVAINYMVHDNAVGYQVRDVYVTGTISELATKCSEFATIMRTNGIDGLIASLNKKADDLRG